MKFIPVNQRKPLYLILAAVWLLLGVAGLFVDFGNYFFYGYFVLGALYVYAYFAGVPWKTVTEKREDRS